MLGVGVEGLGPRVLVIAGLAATQLQMAPPSAWRPAQMPYSCTSTSLPRRDWRQRQEAGGHRGAHNPCVGHTIHCWGRSGTGQDGCPANPGCCESENVNEHWDLETAGRVGGGASLPCRGWNGGFLGKDCGVGEGRASWKGQDSGSLPPSWVPVSECSQSF